MQQLFSFIFHARFKDILIYQIYVASGTKVKSEKSVRKMEKCLALLRSIVQSKRLMKSITHSQLLKLIENTKGAAIVGLTALTDAKARKTGSPFTNGVNKHVRAVGFVGADYGAAVQREGARQDASLAAGFQAKPLPWGAWLVPNKVITHKGELYLRTQSTPGQRKRQPARLLAYRDNDGKFLSPAGVKPFLAEKVESSTQAAVGLEGKIDVRTYKFSSIRTVRINGRTFQLVKD